MRADFPPSCTPRESRKVRRGPTLRIEESLQDLAGGHGKVVIHAEQPWASITFAGSRHRITLGFTGTEAISGAEQLIARLPDHEFSIPGQLVAEATIAECEHVATPDEHMRLIVELLLLEEG